jgi:hypothetical protein
MLIPHQKVTSQRAEIVAQLALKNLPNFSDEGMSSFCLQEHSLLPSYFPLYETLRERLKLKRAIATSSIRKQQFS